ncbi:MAG TPA: site-specific integrase [Solirubrobacteraceae bacterium]|nr:site-specific integrase [Solirubrobacteraceae bacterium]
MIIKRGDRFGVRVYVARRQVWVGTFRTRREALQAEREALVRVRPTTDETVAQFVERWLRDFKRPRASTNRHNAYMVKQLVAELGTMKMSDISRRLAREWALRHRASVPVVRALFNDALNEECVTTNPFADLRLDQRHGRRDLVALSEAEVRDLADASLQVFGDYGPTFRACVLFAAYVGLRPAEMFLLEWSDIDLAGHQVHISKSLGNTGEVTLPKNGLRRKVVLPPQAKEALLGMPRRAGSPYVFTAPCGRRFSKTSHYYYWRLLRAEAGRGTMAFYELRHFCATHLLELGVSHADVAVQLGHTDGGALVMSTYGHPSDDAARARVLAAYRRNPSWHLKAVGD